MKILRFLCITLYSKETKNYLCEKRFIGFEVLQLLSSIAMLSAWDLQMTLLSWAEQILQRTTIKRKIKLVNHRVKEQCSRLNKTVELVDTSPLIQTEELSDEICNLNSISL